MIKSMVLGFVGVALVGVGVYMGLRVLWTHWIFWLICSLVIMVLDLGDIFCVLFGDSILYHP